MTSRILLGAALSAACLMPLSAAAESVDDLLARATSGLSQFSLDWPLPLFREARARTAPGSPQWIQASYGLATCLHHHSGSLLPKEIAEADALYQEIAETAPDSPYAARSLLNRGRIAELTDWYGDIVDLVKARESYRTVMSRYVDQPVAGEAALRLGASLVQTNQEAEVAEGVKVLESWLTAHPGDPLAAAIWQYLGDTHLRHRQDERAALAAYLKADALGLLWSSHESVLWWRMAQLAERLHDRETAIRYYTRICTDAQTSGRAFESQLALARLGVQPPELTAFTGYPGDRPVFTVTAPDDKP